LTDDGFVLVLVLALVLLVVVVVLIFSIIRIKAVVNPSITKLVLNNFKGVDVMDATKDELPPRIESNDDDNGVIIFNSVVLVLVIEWYFLVKSNFESDIEFMDVNVDTTELGVVDNENAFVMDDDDDDMVMIRDKSTRT